MIFPYSVNPVEVSVAYNQKGNGAIKKRGSTAKNYIIARC